MIFLDGFFFEEDDGFVSFYFNLLVVGYFLISAAALVDDPLPCPLSDSPSLSSHPETEEHPPSSATFYSSVA